MTSAPFQRVLEATGYLTPTGESAPGLMMADGATSAKLKAVFADERVGLQADAVFAAQAKPTSIFKDAGTRNPSIEDLKHWHEAAWNLAVAPLLWIVTPTDIRLYDCYRSSEAGAGTRTAVPLDRFVLDSAERMRTLDGMCGRLATETGAFWSSAIGARINRRHRVDRDLLDEISALEDLLSALPSSTRTIDSSSLTMRAKARNLAQRFIGRCIFTWYLLDRGIAQQFLPVTLPHNLSEMFATRVNAFALFDWLRSTFNGDLFPMDDPGAERNYLTDGHLALIRDFIDGRSLVAERRGQGRLFRFRFDAISVDLISSIYQQFARSTAAEEATSQGLHYTPIELVHLALDPVFEGSNSQIRVIDPACGSGAFLVEAFRRLVWRATQEGQLANRALVRKILYSQLFGIDINHSALGIAAFSLYLTALELNEEPIVDIHDLKFDRLINTTLFKTDTIDDVLPKTLTATPFDAVVGNPPWTFVSKGKGKKRRRNEDGEAFRPRRSPDQAFLSIAADLAGKSGRVGMVMKATPFFSKDTHAVESRAAILERLDPTALINLSYLRKEGLFLKARGPALLFFARCTLVKPPARLLVGSVPWTPDYKRTGVFHIGPGEIRSVPLKAVLETPPLLKATAFGTVRDGWLIDKLEKSFPTFFLTLDDVLQAFDRNRREHRGQGYQVQGDANTPPKRYRRLKVVTPGTFTPFRLDEEELQNFGHATLHRPRRESIFRGPLLLCPKVSNSSGVERGRYSAAVHEKSVLYTENFYGVSFLGAKPNVQYVLSGILNSSLTAFQFALGGSTWGLERPTVEPHDLLSLRVPDLAQCEPKLLEAVVKAEKRVATHLKNTKTSDTLDQLLDQLDQAVFDLYRLEPDERILVNDSVSRARYLVFENRAERSAMVRRPSPEHLKAYAKQVGRVVNGYLRARGERHLEAEVYTKKSSESDFSAGVPGVTAVRFLMTPGAPPTEPVVQEGDPVDLTKLANMLRGQLTSKKIPPYLNERRVLRIYGGEDLFVLKPTEIRYWTATAGLNDADVILADHWI